MEPAIPNRLMVIWLITVAVSIFIMVVIGAITRLTESGLSIAEWKPLLGVLPPLSDIEWQRVFGLYQQTPEYRLKNTGMDIAAFKNIFFWEWLHRTWGHVIGIVYAVPLAVLAALGRIPRAFLPRLLGIFALGGLQGVIGWYMVASGLVDRPDVSHLRLALHLGVALLIFALVVWTICDARQPRAGRVPALGWAALGLLCATIVYGAFVAGLDAGLAYNTWPLMDGAFLPPEVDTLSPWYVNLIDNTAAVQFIHRWLAVVAAGTVLLFAWRARPLTSALWLAGAIVLQVLLGISTLLTHVDIALAALHQANAVITLTLLLITLHARKAPQS